jgi:GNAT superfamily N-acetyltransferase
MVELHSDHPARLGLALRKKLARLSLGGGGYMREYALNLFNDLWCLGDRVYWLIKGNEVIAWAVRTQMFPYEYPCFMVFVASQYRRQGWGTVLYNYALNRKSKQHYEVYGSHSKAAAEFYTQLGETDYN